jgi:hypothetical protein
MSRRWGDNIKIVRNIGYEDVRWIELAKDRVQWHVKYYFSYFAIRQLGFTEK